MGLEISASGIRLQELNRALGDLRQLAPPRHADGKRALIYTDRGLQGILRHTQMYHIRNGPAKVACPSLVEESSAPPLATSHSHCASFVPCEIMPGSLSGHYFGWWRQGVRAARPCVRR